MDDGDTDGRSDGLWDGAVDGVVEGFCDMDGNPLGWNDGPDVGSPEGVAVTGVCVGILDGILDGHRDGAAVGILVGSLLGGEEGPSDGIREGAMDGAWVTGASVCAPDGEDVETSPIGPIAGLPSIAACRPSKSLTSSNCRERTSSDVGDG